MTDYAASTVLHESSECRVELFPAPVWQRRLAVTFTAAANRSLDGNPGPGPLLNSMGYDVVSFKRTVDDWYQGLDPAALDAVRSHAVALSYERRVAVGDSAGGYAAIAFSRRLQLDTVLAYAPQYRIDADFDTRWRDIGQALTWRYRIDADAIAPSCAYVIVYDPLDVDALHLEHLATLIPAGCLRPWKVPDAGHGAMTHLFALGQLKAVTSYAIEHRSLEAFVPPTEP